MWGQTGLVEQGGSAWGQREQAVDHCPGHRSDEGSLASQGLGEGRDPAAALV